MDFLDKSKEFLNNDYVSSTLLLLSIVFASLIVPKVTSGWKKIFNNVLCKLLVLFLVVYLLRHDVKVAIVSAIVVLVVLLLIKDDFAIENELMTNTDKCDCNCECGCNSRIRNEIEHVPVSHRPTSSRPVSHGVNVDDNHVSGHMDDNVESHDMMDMQHMANDMMDIHKQEVHNILKHQEMQKDEMQHMDYNAIGSHMQMMGVKGVDTMADHQSAPLDH